MAVEIAEQPAALEATFAHVLPLRANHPARRGSAA